MFRSKRSSSERHYQYYYIWKLLLQYHRYKYLLTNAKMYIDLLKYLKIIIINIFIKYCSIFVMSGLLKMVVFTETCNG
jgi:hypothetical protein